jgi:hypothetical protein
MFSKQQFLFGKSVAAVFLALVAVAGIVSCGGPSDPSGEGVTLRGAIVGGPVGYGAPEPILVTVQEAPAITTTVASDGSFTLRGLPDGAFTLEFTRGSRSLGTLSFDAVKPNQEITIRVALSVDGRSIVLLEEKRNGIGHGEIEIEGRVEAVLALNPEGESRFLIDGYNVVVKAGETAIRQGNQPRSVNDLTVGRRVHVKGAWLTSTTGTGQMVLAREIKLQGEDGGDDDASACLISGGKQGKKIQLEGHVAEGATTRFLMQVNGNRAQGLVDVDADAASFECNGQKGLSDDQCRALVVPGAKIHVSGLLEACDATVARVVASEVKLQK